MNILCDNQVTISIVSNPVHHIRTKHIEVDCYFIKEKIKSNLINLPYAPKRQQVVAILTNALPQVNFEKLSFKLSLINIYNPT